MSLGAGDGFAGGAGGVQRELETVREKLDRFQIPLPFARVKSSSARSCACQPKPPTPGANRCDNSLRPTCVPFPVIEIRRGELCESQLHSWKNQGLV